MVKRLIELVVAAVIIYAGWNAGTAYLHYFQFNDALGELARFSAASREDQIRERVLQLAEEHSIPLDPGAIEIRHSRQATEISAPYTESVKLLPNYVYDWSFEPRGKAFHGVP